MEPQTNDRKPTFCMINYNGAEFIHESLAAGVAQEHLFGEMIFVDNGSTDESARIVEREFPQVRIVSLPTNGGAAVARNAGFKEARSDLILFLDNDVSLLPECIERLQRAINDNPLAVVAMPAIIYAHQPDTVQYAGAESHYLGLMVLDQQDCPLEGLSRSIRTATSVVTCCFLADRSKIGEAAPFDESYFYIMEDHDFGVRLRHRGFELLTVPEAQVLHGKGTEGMSIRRVGGYAPIRIYCIIRNRWLFLLKHYRLRSLLVLSPMLLLYDAVQFAQAIRKGWFKEWRRAASWIFSNWSMIMAKRRQVLTQSRVPDRDLFLGGPVPLRQEIAASSAERVAKSALDAVASAYWRLARPCL